MVGIIYAVEFSTDELVQTTNDIYLLLIFPITLHQQKRIYFH